jgi:hypothetical protein
VLDNEPDQKQNERIGTLDIDPGWYPNAVICDFEEIVAAPAVKGECLVFRARRHRRE